MTTWANGKPDQGAVRAAMAACFAMIAYHVGSKAVRDAFFLSQFEVTSLPLMVVAAALVSIGAVFGAAAAMSRFTPARVAPAAFAASALLHVGAWFLAESHPRESAIAVYLLSIALGSILTSAFWSVLNERFDPLTAKSLVGRVAAAGTLGGMMGGVIAERVAAMASLPAMLPVLAAYHLLCTPLLLRLAGPGAPATPRRDEAQASGLEVLRQAPYLKTVAALVVLGTISAAMLDYVFKSAALTEFGKGEGLLRFFALFYAVTGVLTFLVQSFAARPLLNWLGTARTVATLPFSVSLGGAIALLTGGFATATLARGLETVFRGSLFRAGYEIFFMPMPVHEKRAAKGVVDVAFDRLGDAVGSGFVSLLIALGVVALPPAVLTAAVLVSLAALYTATRLEGAYLGVLEHGLRERSSEIASDAADESLALSMYGGSMTMANSALLRADFTATNLPGATAASLTQLPAPSAVPGHSTTIATDPLLQRIAALRSGDRRAIRQAIPGAPSQPELIPHLVRLLGRDDVCHAVMKELEPSAERHAGQLIDSLLDPETDFAVRRRLPRVLSAVARQNVAEGLLLALNDRRFEVRYQCGRALAIIAERNRLLRFSQEEVFGYLQKELAVSKPVWDSHRLLDPAEETEGSPVVDEFLRARTSRGLQHLFTLLSLVYPPEPLKLAFQGLHIDDPQLRGTALEYLSSMLPRDLRDRLWPLLDQQGGTAAKPDGRSREQVLAELMRSDQTIYLRIEELRKSGGAPEEPPSA